MKTTYYKIFALILSGVLMTACAEWEPVPDNSNTPPELENAHVISITELLGTFPGNGLYGPDSVTAGFDSIPQYVAPDGSLQDYYIYVQVLANDISGNLYKSLYVRDISVEDGRALNISTDKTGLYNYYPVGQKLYIKCSGLCRGQYGGLPQLGYRYQDDNLQWKLGRIPDQMFTDHVFKDGPVDPDNLPQPIEITDLSQLTDNLYSQLVRFHKVRFMPDAVGEQFAPAPPVGANPTSVDRLFTVDGKGSGLTLRTSTACRFFSTPVPAGEGDMVCIFTIYNSTMQFYLRDLSDLDTAGFNSTADIDRPVFYQSFSNGLDNFTAVSEKGSAKWESATYGGGCVMLKGQNSGINLDWLYSPVIELPADMNRIEASFYQCVAYASGKGAEICQFRITDEVEAEDPTKAEWETLTIPEPFTGTGWDFQSTGRIDISKYKGKSVRVAFVFDDPEAVEATWELNKLQIIANKE